MMQKKDEKKGREVRDLDALKQELIARYVERSKKRVKKQDARDGLCRR